MVLVEAGQFLRKVLLTAPGNQTFALNPTVK